MRSEAVKVKTVDKLKKIKNVFIMLLIFAVLWPVNRNLAYVFSIHMGLFIVFVSCTISILRSTRSDIEVPVSSVMIVMVYSLLLLIPTIKLISDIPDYLNNNLSIERGEIERTAYRRGYLEVYINDECISFWDTSTNFKNIPDEVQVQITYLPRSKQGVAYELIEN